MRCAFHGWLFDVNGRCLDTPAEPEGSRLCESVRQRSYPVVERNGILWAYLGDGAPPAFPELDCFVAPSAYTFAFKGYWDCNWLQALEIGIDPAHASFLHRFTEDEDPGGSVYGRQFRAASASSDMPMTRVLREYHKPKLDHENAPWGFRIFALRGIDEARTHVRVTNMIFPQAFVIPLSPEMTITQWHVPVDDTGCYWYAIFTAFDQPVDKAEMRRQRLQLYQLPDYRPRVHRGNDYGFNADEQRDRTYTGMGFDINVHDQWAVESQGPIHDRTREYLGTSDRIIVAYRRRADEGDRAGDAGRAAADGARRGGGEARARAGDDRRHRAGGRLAAVLARVRRRAAAALGLGGRAARSARGLTAAMSFVNRFGLWTDAQRAAARLLPTELAGRGVEVIRFSFPDQHGILRGKTVTAAELPKALADGVTVTSTLFAKDTSHRTVFPVFTRGGGFGLDGMEGGADALMIADPTTFRVLPWAPKTGWLLCDPYFASGEPVPFATRPLAPARARAAGRGGLRIRRRARDRVPRLPAGRSAHAPGARRAAGRAAGSEPAHPRLPVPDRAAVRPARSGDGAPAARPRGARAAAALARGGVRSEPGRVHARGAARARLGRRDGAVPERREADLPAQRLSRDVHVPAAHSERDVERLASAPVAAAHRRRRERLHARGRRARRCRRPGGSSSPGCSRTRAARPRSPRRRSTATSATGRTRSPPTGSSGDATTAGAMLRVIGGQGDPATRIENRIGEPAANPYLYFASQIVSGLDGIARKLDPGPSADTPYEATAPTLPHTLADALAALRADACLRDGLGGGFVDYFCRIKEAELARFNLEVSEWEQREYFDLF